MTKQPYKICIFAKLITELTKTHMRNKLMLGPWLLALSVIAFVQAKAQSDFNLDLVGQLEYTQGCNDIWGYADENGDEYAIMGTRTGTAVIALDGPDAPREITFIPGTSSTWRDMKTWGDYAYVTTDVGEDGLLIIDLSEVENDIVNHHFWKPNLELEGRELGPLNKCHNIYLDEFGYVYLAGCNIYSGGILIFDVFTEPDTPALVGAGHEVYSHDCMAQNNLLYSGDIYRGEFSVQDVTDKSNVTLLARETTTGTFTHNAWVSADNNFLYTTDEIVGGFVDAYDISDLGDIQRLDFWRPDNAFEEEIIPHNAHYYNGYLVVSWYIEGAIVLDVSQPDNMVLVAQYDTYTGNQTRFNGAWGAYPYLPSGRMLVSDINSGLYVFEPNYVRAARIEGLVTDVITGERLAGVSIEIDDLALTTDETNGDGTYKTGTASFGRVAVTYSRNNYLSHTDTLDLSEGVNIVNDVALVPDFNVFEWELTVIDSASLQPIEGVQIHLVANDDETYDYLTDANGQLTQPLIPEGSFEAFVGKWGYKEAQIDDFTIDQKRTDTIYLPKGYLDYFNLDLGWTHSGTSNTGRWEIATPLPTEFDGKVSNPGEDDPTDPGSQAYVTGNNNADAGVDDVDNGFVLLESPSMDLSNYENVSFDFSYWFFNDGGQGNPPNDSLKVELVTSEGVIPVEAFTFSFSSWQPYRFRLEDYYNGDVTELRIRFIATDYANEGGHLVEAGVDHFVVNGDVLSSIQPSNISPLSFYPNPANEVLNLELEAASSIEEVLIVDLNGRIMTTFRIQDHQIQIGQLPSGAYRILIKTDQDWKQGQFIKL